MTCDAFQTVRHSPVDRTTLLAPLTSLYTVHFITLEQNSVSDYISRSNKHRILIIVNYQSIHPFNVTFSVLAQFRRFHE